MAMTRVDNGSLRLIRISVHRAVKVAEVESVETRRASAVERSLEQCQQVEREVSKVQCAPVNHRADVLSVRGRRGREREISEQALIHRRRLHRFVPNGLDDGGSLLAPPISAED